MSHRVTGFPFNVLEDPMYVGSTMAFLGTAIWCESFAGLVLSALVWIVYSIALRYEGPFTGMIYEKAAEAKAKEAETAKEAAKVKKDVSPKPKTAALPSTPRKSERVAEKAATATATATSTADAPAPTNGAATPRRRGGRKSAVNDNLASTPMRVTRSRSKARSSPEASD